MAKYKAYPEYKDSDIEWLGKIPSGWLLKKAKYIFQRVQRPLRDIDGVVTAFRDGQVTLRTNRRTDGFTNSIKEIGYQGVRRNDLVIHAMDGFAGAIGVSDSDGKCSPVCSVCIPWKNQSVNMHFYGYLVRQLAVTDFILSLAKGIRERSTEFRFSEFSGLILPIPPIYEQNQIATFLDYETAKIDNLIEKQQQLIELLKEKRQAVISHAVTKGINPDVPMKDSGVEWLGEVPEHWEVKRIKHFGKVIGGFAFKSTDFTDEGYPVIKISNVSHLSFDWGDSSFLPLNFPFMHKEYLVPNGALVFAMTRPVISGGIKVTLLDDDSAPLVNQRVGFMVVKSQDIAKYILISTQSSAFLAHFVNNMTVTNQPNISSEGIESIYIPVPPRNEINCILHYVGRMNESYNGLIAKALLQVSLLQERRTALISAAVTGKIDVRDWVAPDIQDVEEPQEATA